MCCLAGEEATDPTNLDMQTGECIQQVGETVVVLSGHEVKSRCRILYRELMNGDALVLDNLNFPSNVADDWRASKKVYR